MPSVEQGVQSMGAYFEGERFDLYWRNMICLYVNVYMCGVLYEKGRVRSL